MKKLLTIVALIIILTLCIAYYPSSGTNKYQITVTVDGQVTETWTETAQEPPVWKPEHGVVCTDVQCRIVPLESTVEIVEVK